jgi:hypothetical protein
MFSIFQLYSASTSTTILVLLLFIRAWGRSLIVQSTHWFHCWLSCIRLCLPKMNARGHRRK